MFGLLRALLLLAVGAAIGAYFLGYRLTDGRIHEPATVGTSGVRAGTETARERGAEIGEKVGEAAGRLGEAFSDGELTAKIKSKIALDDTLEGSDIHVSTRDRVVTLTGTVNTRAERTRALQLVRETHGVKSVTDRLSGGK